MRVPEGPLICARPVAETLKVSRKGLSRHASRITKLKRVLARSMRSNTCPTSTEKNVTSSSEPMTASIGTR